jgi:hypothetical protein
MADLMFSHDAGMQDGTGDWSYMKFLLKHMSVVAAIALLTHYLHSTCSKTQNIPSRQSTLSATSVSPTNTSLRPTKIKIFHLNGDKMLANRQKLGSSRRDLFQHLLAEDSENRPAAYTQGAAQL